MKFTYVRRVRCIPVFPQSSSPNDVIPTKKYL